MPSSRVDSSSHAQISLPAALHARLSALVRRQRRAALFTGFAFTLAVVCVLVTVQTATDWWFGLPWAVRLGLLVVDGVVLTWMYLRLLHRPLRTKVSHAEAAVLIERRWPVLQQSLITAVELAGRSSPAPQLGARVMEETQARSADMAFKEAVPLRRAGWAGFVAGVAVSATLALAVLAGSVGLALCGRLLLLDIPRPAKTVIVPITRDLVVALGTDVQLSARGERLVPAEGRIELVFAGEPPRADVLAVSRDQERVFAATVPAAQQDFRYRFYLRDAVGPEFSVRVKNRPAIAALECEAISPEYTKLPRRTLAPASIAIIAGGQLVIRAEATERLRSATVVLRGVEKTIEARIDVAGTRYEAVVPMMDKALTGWSLHLVDVDGVTSRDETVYPIEVIPDLPPTLELVQPNTPRETITLIARLPLVVRAEDDFALARLTLNTRLLPPADTEAKVAVPAPVQVLPIALLAGSADGHFGLTIDPIAQSPTWKEGDVVEYWIEALDNNTVTGPGMTESPHQEIKIISRAQKEAEILRRIRRRAGEIDDLATSQGAMAEAIEETLSGKKPGGSPEAAANNKERKP